MTIIHDNIPSPDGTRRQTRQQYHNNTVTRVISSGIYLLNLKELRGIYSRRKEDEDSLTHLERITLLDNEDFIALSTYQGEKKNGV